MKGKRVGTWIHPRWKTWSTPDHLWIKNRKEWTKISRHSGKFHISDHLILKDKLTFNSYFKTQINTANVHKLHNDFEDTKIK